MNAALLFLWVCLGARQVNAALSANRVYNTGYGVRMSRPTVMATLRREHANMTAEEQLFFPEALRVLSEADWVAVDRKTGGRDDPLFDSI